MNKNQASPFPLVNNQTLIVTVDIGKVMNMGYCRCPDGTEVTPFPFSNDTPGFQSFWQRLCHTQATQALEQVVVGLESTGSYGEPLVHFLRHKPVHLVQVNPMHTKRLKELHGNSPNKTDRKDPKVIADIIELGHALTLVVPEGAAAELRRLTHARERSMVRRTALWNQLQDLEFLLFPEFQPQMKDIKSKSARYLLQHYPSPQAILACGVDALGQILHQCSRGQLGEERARALYEGARTSVGLIEGQSSLLLELGHLSAQIEATDAFIAQLETQMATQLPHIPYSRFLLSVKGIGTVTAASLIGEVGDFRQFSTLAEITKLAGLDLFEVSSGQHKGERHISKRGRSLVRKVLYLATLNMIRKGGIFHETYQGYLQRGMPKMKAMIAISRKLLRILFALVRDRCEYIPDYTAPCAKKAA